MESMKEMKPMQLMDTECLVVSDESVVTVNGESEQERISRFADLIRYHALENKEHCKAILKTVDKEALLRELLFKISGVSAEVFNSDELNNGELMQLLEATETVGKLPLEIIEV